jgi:hypothetical protein
MKNAVFWDVGPCRSCLNRRFGGTYRLHLQSRKIRRAAHVGSSLADFSTLKMEAIHSSETSVQTRSTRRHIPEDGNLHTIPVFAWGDWENSRNNKSEYVGVPAGIRTKHLQGSSLNHWPTCSAPNIMIYLLFVNDKSVCFYLYGKLLASHGRRNLGLGSCIIHITFCTNAWACTQVNALYNEWARAYIHSIALVCAVYICASRTFLIPNETYPHADEWHRRIFLHI